MKRRHPIFNAIIAFVMVFSLSGIPQAFAATESESAETDGSYTTYDPDFEHRDGTDVNPDDDLAVQSDSASEGKTALAPTAAGAITDAGERALRVTVMQGTFPAEDAEFTITASTVSGASTTTTAKAKDTGSAYRKAEAVLRHLTDAEYKVTISAPGAHFANYEQTIAINGYDAAITVYTTNVTTNGAQPGIMAYGDLNGDGVINDVDANMMVDGIHDATASSSETSEDDYVAAHADLNLEDFDGTDAAINLIDLQVLAEGLNMTPATSEVKQMVPASTVTTSQETSTTVLTGDVNELLNSTSDAAVGLNTASAQAISEDNPVAISFDFTQAPAAASNIEGVVIACPPNTGTAISQGEVEVETVDGNIINVPISKPATQAQTASASTYSQAAYSPQANARENAEPSLLDNVMHMGATTAYAADVPTATFDSNGMIVIDFSGKIAIKKVTIRVTETANKANLAEITTVEFLNNMESHIAPPDMNVPSNIVLAPGSNQFSVSWDKEPNVTGYTISYVEVDPDTKATVGAEEFVRTNKTSASAKQYGGRKMKNGHTFAVKIESTNGDWRSGWSEVQYVTPRPSGKPPAPEGIRITAGLRSLSVGWKDMDDTDSYELYYRVRTDQSASQAPYTKWTDGNGNGTLVNNSCTIGSLQDNTTYQVYVVGYNAEFGTGPASIVSAGTTITVELAELPEYNIVNTRDSSGQYRTGIENAMISSNRGNMLDSPLDANGNRSAWGLFDNNAESRYYMQDWDDGGCYVGSGYPRGGKGVSVSFSSPQTISMISLSELLSSNTAYSHVFVQYRTPTSTGNENVPATIHQRVGSNGQKYHLIKLAHPVNATWMNIGVGRADGRCYNVTISELRFHNDGGLESDILDLYTDNLYLQLRDDVTSATIDALQTRLDTPDPTSGEYHPFRSSLQIELNAARQLLADGPNLDDIQKIDNTITAKKDARNLGIGGLNAWQPLGISAGTGEEVIIYVGAPGATRGNNSSLQLVMTQQHPEASNVATTVCTLKNGRNEITLPSLVSSDLERGGQLYIVYGANNDKDNWAVRVAGGTPIPTVNLHQVTDETARLEAVTAYVEELESHVADLQATHAKLHESSQVKALNYAYDQYNCIANATDVMLDEMMYSVPASQMLAAAGNGTTAQKAARLLNAFDSMDEMMELFYQHKGLATADVAGVTEANKVPYQHLNIRYCRMFSGAFMYAAGNHVGIEWGSVPGLGSQKPTITDDGLKTNGGYFGWGISHEIGHQINQAQYAYAEVTNNYFAQVTKSDETSNSVRWQINDVYDRVTSGEIGRGRSVFTQLAMYWQLHLAYDPGHVSKRYDNYNDILANYFFARVDSYARNPQSAPAPGGIALALNAGESQNIFRLSCAAAQKDLTEFFTRWGIIPDANSKAYASQFTPETRALFYGDDDQKNIANQSTDSGLVNGANVVSATATPDGSEVTLQMSCSSQVSDVLHGYEVTRISYAQGEQQREVVGFTTTDTFVDDAAHLGNRVVGYEVCMVDKFLNRSASFATDWIKLDGDGRIAHDSWKATTNMASADDVAFEGTDDDPDTSVAEATITTAIDGDRNTTYTGTAAGEDAYVQIDMGMVRELTSVRYTFSGSGGPAITDYSIQVSTDGANFREIGTGTFNLNSNNQATAYFDNGSDPWICTYDVRYVRIQAVGKNSVGISEIDIYGPSGDNVDFLEANGETAIGTLASDYIYQKESEGLTQQVIPAGSLVLTGEFKGNPAYNVVVVYDNTGKIVGGVDAEGALVAHQIILADDPGNALLGETSTGRWVYWIEPGDLGSATSIGSQVRAELYRVDNALTNEGQRLTSDSMLTAMPSISSLPSITINGD